jgi:hypothetical protein
VVGKVVRMWAGRVAARGSGGANATPSGRRRTSEMRESCLHRG